MNQIGYAALKRFDPESTDWKGYIEWAKLPQLSRIVSMDGCLCPSVFTERTDEDWNHVINENFMIDYFHDLEYLLERAQTLPPCEIIGFVKEPDSPFPHGFTDARFTFFGYDLVDWGNNISSLVNCGGFPDCFDNAELNEFGLLPTFERAIEVRDALLRNHPAEPHAKCAVWPLWLMNRT